MRIATIPRTARRRVPSVLIRAGNSSLRRDDIRSAIACMPPRGFAGPDDPFVSRAAGLLYVARGTDGNARVGWKE